MNERTNLIAVSMSEAARLLSVSRTTLYAWSKLDGFPLIRINGCSRVLVDGLRDWVKKQTEVMNDV